MDNLACFLAGNVEKRENRKIIISKRFKDKNGPVEWIIHPVSAEEDEALRKICTKQVPVSGKKGQFTQVFDANAYLTKLAELQNSYGVMGAEQLIKKMLYKDEFDRLADALVDETDMEDINELVEEAKN